MRVKFLGAYIDVLTMEETVERITGFVNSGYLHRVVTLNPEYLYRAQKQRELLDIVNASDLVTPDGIGIVWGCRIAGYPVVERVTGIDLMLNLCKRAASLGFRVFLLGAAPKVAEEAAQKLRERYPGIEIAGTHHGYFEEHESIRIAKEISKTNAQILFVALGAPKQEMWISKYQPQANVPVAIGVGGSFDVISGRAKRAPLWVQRIRAEWLYRLMQDPSRIKRQLVLPKFAWLVFKKYVI